jgi:hypothetical protein
MPTSYTPGTTPGTTPNPAPQNPPTPPVPVPAYGSTWYNPQTGQAQGQNFYNPNTGQPLVNPNANQNQNQNNSPSQNNSYQSQYNQSQSNQQNAFNQYQSQMQGLINGTTPLNAGQQAQIAGLTQQFQGLIETQKNINDNSIGSARAGAYRSGAVEGTDFMTSTINPIVTAGVNKIKALEIAMASGIAELTTALRNDQIKNVKMLWDDYKANEESKQKVFKDMIDESNKAIQAEQERIMQEEKNFYERTTKPLEDLARNAKNMNAPQDVVNKILASSNLSEGYENAGSYASGGTGIIGEYNYYKAQAESRGQNPISFNEYQVEDANRKQLASNVTTEGLNPKQTQNFLSITTKFQADPFIANAIKGQTAIAIADQIIADPQSAVNQLKSLYALVKNLDPDSAVREGEITLADKTQSYLQQFGNTITRIVKGRVVSPTAAVEMAEATKELATAWQETAKRRENQYKAQASGAGIKDAFDEYLSSSGMGYNTGNDITDYEEEATGYIQSFLNAHPDKEDKFYQDSDTFTETMGREPTAGEFLQMFPEYATGMEMSSNIQIPSSSRLAKVNNNPGNLRYVGQKGATKGEGGFAKFSSPEEGVKALENQIRLDSSRGLTLAQFINKYAPPSENNTSQYLTQMMKTLNVPANTKISKIDLKKLTKAIALKESSTKIG